jgi:CheY-like chemotaxis protein
MAHPLLLGRCLKGAEVEDSARLKRNLTTTTYIGQQTFGKPMDTQTGLNLIQDYFRLLPGSGILLMKNASLLASPVSVSSDSLIPHILIVDDSSTIRHLLRTFYKRSGYTAFSVASGEEALAKLAQGNIDLVITDIQLPGMSGTELVSSQHEGKFS